MAGARGYVTSAVTQINEATARLLVRDIEMCTKIARVKWLKETSRVSLKSDSSGPQKKCGLSCNVFDQLSNIFQKQFPNF